MNDLNVNSVAVNCAWTCYLDAGGSNAFAVALSTGRNTCNGEAEWKTKQTRNDLLIRIWARGARRRRRRHGITLAESKSNLVPAAVYTVVFFLTIFFLTHRFFLLYSTTSPLLTHLLWRNPKRVRTRSSRVCHDFCISRGDRVWLPPGRARQCLHNRIENSLPSWTVVVRRPSRSRPRVHSRSRISYSRRKNKDWEKKSSIAFVGIINNGLPQSSDNYTKCSRFRERKKKTRLNRYDLVIKIKTFFTRCFRLNGPLSRVKSS